MPGRVDLWFTHNGHRCLIITPGVWLRTQGPGAPCIERLQHEKPHHEVAPFHLGEVRPALLSLPITTEQSGFLQAVVTR